MTRPKRVKGLHLESWRDRENKALARRRDQHPRRDLLLIRKALNNLRLKWCGEVSFWNPLHRGGKNRRIQGGLQWADLVVRARPRALIILYDLPSKRFHAHEKIAWQNKTRWLEERHPVLILKPNRTTQEYQILILRKIRQLQKEYENDHV